MNAKLTISRRDDSCMVITIKDGASSARVVSVKVDPADFTMALTGLAEIPAKYEFMPTPQSAERYGKTRITEHVTCERSWDKTEQLRIVNADFQEKYKEDGWIIFSDGTTTQQNSDGHRYLIIKYLEGNQVGTTEK